MRSIVGTGLAFYTGAQTELLSGWQCRLTEKAVLLRTLPEAASTEALPAPRDMDVAYSATLGAHPVREVN